MHTLLAVIFLAVRMGWHWCTMPVTANRIVRVDGGAEVIPATVTSQGRGGRLFWFAGSFAFATFGAGAKAVPFTGLFTSASKPWNAALRSRWTLAKQS
jgi:hypothetical protein